MAYASWSVVFGEQPSAAKWNILGTNDATFNTWITGTRYAVGTTTISATGSKSVTGVGFTPKMVEFLYLTTAASNARDGLGVMTATSQFSLSVSTSSAGNSATNADTSTCIRADSGGGTTFIVASYTSMDADGFTINVTTLASGPHVIGYKAFA